MLFCCYLPVWIYVLFILYCIAGNFRGEISPWFSIIKFIPAKKFVAMKTKKIFPLENFPLYGIPLVQFVAVIVVSPVWLLCCLLYYNLL